MGEITLFWFHCVYEASASVPNMERIHVIVYFVIQSIMVMIMMPLNSSQLLKHVMPVTIYKNTSILLLWLPKFVWNEDNENLNRSFLWIYFIGSISTLFCLICLEKREWRHDLFFFKILWPLTILHRTLINRDVRLQEKLSRKLN